jgi:hypothetical protein
VKGRAFGDTPDFRDGFALLVNRQKPRVNGEVPVHQDHPDSEKDGKPYYVRAEFASDLLEFVKTWYLRRTRNRRVFGAILGFELAHRQEPPAPSRPQAEDAPRFAPGVRLIRLNTDYHRVLGCLRNRKALSAVPAGRVTLAGHDTGEGKVRVLRLSPLLAQILAKCDGTRSVRQIARQLRPGAGPAGIPRYTITLFGLAALREQGLIVDSVLPPSSGSSI